VRHPLKASWRSSLIDCSGIELLLAQPSLKTMKRITVRLALTHNASGEVRSENQTGQSGRSIGAPERKSNLDIANPTDELSVTDPTLPDGDAAMARSSASKQSTEQAERALLDSISAGDRSAMDQLYLLYFARLAHFFWHLTAPADLVEELINDTMFEVWREGASIRAKVSVSVAIMGLAYSRGQKHLADTSAIRPNVEGPKQDAEHDESNPEPFLLERPVEERAVLHLGYAGGHSRQDVAEIMNISCEAVDALLGNARRGYLQGHVRTGNRD
jgi:RNA polymerase sigma-70 factor, ECF subfamily